MTSRLDVAVVLSRVDNLQVYNVGGSVEPLHRAQQGTWALDELRRFRVDLALVSLSGLSVEHGLFASTTMAAAITAAEIEIADRVWLLMEGSAIGRTGAVRVGDLAGIDHVFGAGGVAASARAAVRDAGIPLSCTD